MSLSKLKTRLTGSLLTLATGCLAWVLFAPLPEGTTPEYSKVVFSDDGSLLRAYLTPDEKWRHPVSLDSIPRPVQDSLLCLEDQRFYWHPGIDPMAIGRAFFQNINAGQVVSGGSTITMQLVRLLKPRPRTLKSKILEALTAIQLELRLSKKEILTLYLTYAPYGSNLEGLETAAQSYFNTSANRLNLTEISFLLLLPQSPHRFQNLSPAAMKNERRKVLSRLKTCGIISNQELTRADSAPIPSMVHKSRIIAAHLADYLVTRTPNKRIIQSTISLDVQRVAEQLAAENRRHLNTRGIQNIGILVVDHNSGELKGAVGNFDYFDGSHGQSYQSFNTLRSPGSTLKPFLYAYAMSKGKILPDSLLLDIPTHFEAYDPKNFDGQYGGLVSAQQALSKSLNVPFVRMLQDIGVDEFVKVLESGGLTEHIALDQLGLSTIVGAMEVNAMQLTNLYASLARGGQVMPLKIEQSQQMDSFQWLDSAAVYLTGQALASRDRPDYPLSRRHLHSDLPIRWKTGTSQGRKDAWSIGYNDRYTIAVWLGNLNQQSSHSLVGGDTAGPLMFDMFARLGNTKKTEPSPPWDSLGEVEVCSFSGLKSTEACPSIKRTLAVHKHPLHKTCPYHEHIMVNRMTGLRANHSCRLPANQITTISTLTLPPQILYWTRKSLQKLTTRPEFDPSCSELPVEKGKLTISSPIPNGQYFLTTANGKDLRIPLEIEARAPVNQLTCFVDGEKVPLSQMHFRKFLQVGPGKHHLFCADPYGNSGKVAFRVKPTDTM